MQGRSGPVAPVGPVPPSHPESGRPVAPVGPVAPVAPCSPVPVVPVGRPAGRSLRPVPASRLARSRPSRPALRSRSPVGPSPVAPCPVRCPGRAGRAVWWFGAVDEQPLHLRRDLTAVLHRDRRQPVGVDAADGDVLVGFGRRERAFDGASDRIAIGARVWNQGIQLSARCHHDGERAAAFRLPTRLARPAQTASLLPSPPSSSARRLLLRIDMRASVVAIRRGTLPHAGPPGVAVVRTALVAQEHKRLITLVSGRPAAPPPASVIEPGAHPMKRPQVYRLSLERSSAQALSLDRQSGRAEDVGHGYRDGRQGSARAEDSAGDRFLGALQSSRGRRASVFLLVQRDTSGPGPPNARLPAEAVSQTFWRPSAWAFAVGFAPRGTWWSWRR